MSKGEWRPLGDGERVGRRPAQIVIDLDDFRCDDMTEDEIVRNVAAYATDWRVAAYGVYVEVWDEEEAPLSSEGLLERP